jgi:hypothetical protein
MAGRVSRWLAPRGHKAALVEIPEQPDRAGPSGREAAHCRSEGCAGAADMLFGEEAIGAAADDLGDRFVGRGCRQTLGHDGGYGASRPGKGFR